jgi:hypothetical protein
MRLLEGRVRPPRDCKDFQGWRVLEEHGLQRVQLP